MRVPLHIKLALSYLVVVGLVLVPTAIYLQTSLRSRQRDVVHGELQRELEHLTSRLDAAPPERLDEQVAVLCGALPLRMTVVEPGGRVVCDSQHGSLGNHGDREEVREAFGAGEGWSVRRSATTGEVTLYVARRFPGRGAVRGVIRLSRPVSSVDAAAVLVGTVMRQTSAVALTVAALLSLLAALVASKPLRHMASAARSFSEGDFAAELPQPSDDEIGEVSTALGHLASQLRGKLLASGADRATLYAVMDDLPVGVVLYDASRRPVRANSVARRLLALRPHDEQSRCTELPELAPCREAVDRLIEDGFTREVSVSPSWLDEGPLRMRWIAAYAPDGERCPALIVLDGGPEQTLAATREMLARCAEALRGGDQAGLARAAEALLPVNAPEPDGVRVQALGPLVRAAQQGIAARLEADGVRIDVSGADLTLAVVEIDGRARRALEALLGWAADARAGAPTVRIRVSAGEGSARVIVRGSAEVAAPTADMESWLGPMGGTTGERVNEDQVERWVSLPLG